MQERGSSYGGPSSDCLRTMRDTRIKDASALLLALFVYDAVLESQAAFSTRIANNPQMSHLPLSCSPSPPPSSPLQSSNKNRRPLRN